MSHRIPEFRQILKDLEGVQRHIGRIQEAIIDLLATGSSIEQDTVAASMPVEDECEKLENPAISSVRPIEWLASKGIVVESVRERQELDPVFDRLSNYFGRRLGHLRSFYNVLKHQLAARAGTYAERWVSLEGLSPEGISDNVQFGHLLKEHHFLNEFRYIKKEMERPHMLVVANRDPRVINFFTGGWLESFVLQRIREQASIVLKDEVEIELDANVRVRFPNQMQGEFDMLIGVMDHVLWFECKTGDWADMAPKYSRLNKEYLHLPPDRATLVVASPVTDSQKASAAALCGLQIVHASELIDHLNEQMESIRRLPISTVSD